jgi:hypothetical protein
VDSDNVERLVLINTYVNDYDGVRYSDNLREIKIARCQEDLDLIAGLIVSTKAVFWLDTELYNGVRQFLEVAEFLEMSEGKGQVRLWSERDVRRILTSEHVVGGTARNAGHGEHVI